MRRIRCLAVIVTTCAAMSWAPVAFATETSSAPLPIDPVVAQYVEDIPTAQGGHAAGVGQARPLSRALMEKIEQQGGSDVLALEAIASSAGYGNPSPSSSPLSSGSSEAAIWALVAMMALSGVGALAARKRNTEGRLEQ